MKLLAVAGLIAGLTGAMLLVLSYGAGAIWHSIATLGWGGLAAVLGFHAGLIVLMGTGWFLLGRGRADARWPRFVWGRLIRDSAAEALPLSQIGGFVLGARAATLAGVSGGFAAASTVVDVTVELVAQLVYVLVGLILLQILRPQNHFAVPVAVGVAAMGVVAAVFVAVQARGAGAAERAGARLVGAFLGERGAQTSGIQAEIQRLHAKPRVLAACTSVHILSWLLSGIETWLTLHIMGVGISVAEALVIDSLLYGLRSVAFMVPNALGVQEGGFVVLGALFGVGADAALALSFIKRGRDLMIGMPALLVWQMLEGRMFFFEKKNQKTFIH
jgi:putative membrane protein